MRATPLLFSMCGLLLFGCDGGSANTYTGDGGSPGGDGDFSVSEGGAVGQCPCPSGQVCYQDKCFVEQGACQSDDDCQGDSFCHEGVCVPYGPDTKTSDPECKNAGFVAEQLEDPVLKCHWDKAGVRMSPAVADLDGDGKPEIVFITKTNKLVAIRGDTCEELFSVDGNYTQGSNPAIGDLDGDGVPEIISVERTDLVVIHDTAGNKIATAQDAPNRHYTETSGGPAIANLDQTGRPEIVYGGLALRFESGALTTLFNKPVHGGYRGVFSSVADVDLDGTPDIVAGNRIYDGVTGADKTPTNIAAMEGGHTAIAQFDRSTPEPEIVLVRSHNTELGQIIIFHPVTGNVIFGPYTFGERRGGPPTVADFDGDGQPEVAAAGHVGYALFDMECAQEPLPSFCHAPGMRWLKDTQDESSGVTGSSVFDFNGDGKAEVVYRDECWLRVYDGTSGATIFATTVTSGTKQELPAIVDVDNDGHADIVISSDSYTSCGPEVELGLQHGGATQGIMVFQDPKNRWMPSRAIWNQHTYHITNVNDDGTIPVTESNNWESWNNYRQNVQGMLPGEIPGTDMTGGGSPSLKCGETWTLRAMICNRGLKDAAPGVASSFYLGDPREPGSELLCTATTQGVLAVGQCEEVVCEDTTPPQISGSVDLYFRADDDGSGAGSEVECKEQNNLLHIPDASCVVVG